MKTPLRLVLAFLIFALAAAGRADVTLAPLFADGAVLQRDKPLPVFGLATPDEKVTVEFAGQRREATTGRDGRWLVMLDALPASAQGRELTVRGANAITIRDVLVGEVWLCSGQSNMAFAVSRATNGAAEVAAAKYPLIRHLAIERTVAANPALTVKTSGWQSALPDRAGTFTAVGYFFARDLHLKLGVPIGLVNSSWGGTPVESWLSGAALASDPAFQIVDQRWMQTVESFSTLNADYQAKLAAWNKADAAAKTKGKPAQDAFRKKQVRPRAPRGPGDPWTPRGLFNGMINPLLPAAFGGVLWYQGESNAERAGEYHALFRTLVTSWRAHFGQEDLPFYWVNLANFKVPADASGTTYAFLREAQTKTLALPHTGEALAIDIGDPNDIHPTNKQEVGRRLALIAKTRRFGIVGDDRGPVFDNATREGAALRIRFRHAEGGLIARDKPVQSLQLAGADGVWHPAAGKLERDTLVVSSPAVREPVAVRYAWSNAPEANLYNGAGLPATPFRTDKP